MINMISLSLPNRRIKTLLFDFFALAVITILPAVSHMLSFPLYLLEPIRIILVLSMAHTLRKNSYLLALLLPLFSFIISAHPSVLKMFLIASELVLNVWFFFSFTKILKNYFASMFASIVISKIYYYAVKFLFLNFGFINGELLSTPVYIQIIVSLALSFYVYFIFNKREQQSYN